MEFTREPIIETVITPREGYKLVVRSSKGAGQEEFFVDALEVVSFGSSFFLRSLERPKAFLVPTSDYEVLEVREARMVLKNVGTDRTIKIAGGKEAARSKEPREEPKPAAPAAPTSDVEQQETLQQPRGDKRRDRRRNYRRRRRGGQENEEGSTAGSDAIDLPEPGDTGSAMEALETGFAAVSSLLPPPPTLISESLQRYKEPDLPIVPQDRPILSEEVMAKEDYASPQSIDEIFSREETVVTPRDDEQNDK